LYFHDVSSQAELSPASLAPFYNFWVLFDQKQFPLINLCRRKTHFLRIGAFSGKKYNVLFFAGKFPPKPALTSLEEKRRVILM
jgi:hypothetical protein